MPTFTGYKFLHRVWILLPINMNEKKIRISKGSSLAELDLYRDWVSPVASQGAAMRAQVNFVVSKLPLRPKSKPKGSSGAALVLTNFFSLLWFWREFGLYRECIHPCYHNGPFWGYYCNLNLKPNVVLWNRCLLKAAYFQ